jgi:hypothetical protein
MAKGYEQLPLPEEFWEGFQLGLSVFRDTQADPETADPTLLDARKLIDLGAPSEAQVPFDGL